MYVVCVYRRVFRYQNRTGNEGNGDHIRSPIRSIATCTLVIYNALITNCLLIHSYALFVCFFSGLFSLVFASVCMRWCICCVCLRCIMLVYL